MLKKNYVLALALGAALVPSVTNAADHLDGAAVKTDAATDINDVYTWMSADGSKIYLAMTVFPQATTASKFSDQAWYVFHTVSRAQFVTATQTPLDIICGFEAAGTQNISCWFGSSANFLYGDASATAGLTPAASSPLAGKVKVFAGLRSDHFFFNLDGYNNVRGKVKAAAPGLTFDTNGCPAIPAATAGMLRTNLTQNAAGNAAGTDFFASLKTLAIVMEIDKTLLTSGGSLFSVWGGTHKKM